MVMVTMTSIPHNTRSIKGPEFLEMNGIQSGRGEKLVEVNVAAFYASWSEINVKLFYHPIYTTYYTPYSRFQQYDITICSERNHVQTVRDEHMEGPLDMVGPKYRRETMSLNVHSHHDIQCRSGIVPLARCILWR